jgi:hypothetical protein
MINTSRDNDLSGVSIEILEKYVETAIGKALKPIETEISELKTYAENQLMEMRVELGK